MLTENSDAVSLCASSQPTHLTRMAGVAPFRERPSTTTTSVTSFAASTVASNSLMKPGQPAISLKVPSQIDTWYSRGGTR